MKRWSTFAFSAAVAFALTLVGTVRADMYQSTAPATNCKAMWSLPQLGTFGELWTNPEGPYGDTSQAYLFCFYNDPYTNISTGAQVPPVSQVILTAYDGDPREAPLHNYDVRAALCMQNWDYTFWWCTDQVSWTNGTGWQSIVFNGPAIGGVDMPPVFGGWGWGDPMVGMTKTLYVYLPPSSTFTGWTVANAI